MELLSSLYGIGLSFKFLVKWIIIKAFMFGTGNVYDYFFTTKMDCYGNAFLVFI